MNGTLNRKGNLKAGEAFLYKEHFIWIRKLMNPMSFSDFIAVPVSTRRQSPAFLGASGPTRVEFTAEGKHTKLSQALTICLQQEQDYIKAHEDVIWQNREKTIDISTAQHVYTRSGTGIPKEEDA